VDNTLQTCYSDFPKGREVHTHTRKNEGKNKPSEEINNDFEMKLNMF